MSHKEARRTEAFDPEELNHALAGTIFAGKLHYFPETASTNALAIEAALQGASEGELFVADQQTAGRGRGGHGWDSEAGKNLLFSFILRPAIAPADVLWLSLMAGIAVQEAIQEQTGLNPDLRWPNDLLLERKKICGILTELSSETSGVRYVIMGIGINVNQSRFSAELSPIATSLKIESGKEWPRPELFIAVLKFLDAEYGRLISDLTARRRPGPPKLLKRLESASSYVRGKKVHVNENDGYDGVTAGLDERGFLLVRTAEGTRRVISGGVREFK